MGPRQTRDKRETVGTQINVYTYAKVIIIMSYSKHRITAHWIFLATPESVI